MEAQGKLNESLWKSCYSAAVFQDDEAQLPALIAKAEAEIVARGRELLVSADEASSSDQAKEMRALDNALHMLGVLKSCLKLKSATAKVTPIYPAAMNQATIQGQEYLAV